MRAPQLERYEILEEIGQGGMSVVYRAHDRVLHRDVALKVLHNFLANDSEARRRFRREALAVARLKHRWILEIFDSSEPEAAEAYLVCELIRGQTLRSWLECYGVPSLAEVGALIVLALAQALRHAHEQGIIHRDLKPENVMITTDGCLKLMDFGIAQIIGGCTRFTAAGTLLGSPAHMAPEVIDGRLPDHRSDLFSLGTVLYWALTGQLPFEAPNPSALFRKILEGHYASPQVCAPQVGNGLARIVERALETNVDHRYQDIADLISDLDDEVRSAGLSVESNLVEALTDPRGLCRRHQPVLVKRLVGQALKAEKDNDLARAIDRANRVLVHQPDELEANRVLRRATRTKRRAIPLVLGATSVATVAATLIGFAVARPNPPFPSLPEELATSSRPQQLAAAVLPEAKPPPRAAVNRPEGPSPEESDPPQTPRHRRRTRKIERPAKEASKKIRPSPKARPSRKSGSIGERPSVPSAILRVRIGRSFANIRLDGRPYLKNRYRGDLKLTPGVHVVEVIKPGLGRFQPRRIEVTKEGELREQLPNGRNRPIIDGFLDFRVPLSPQQAFETVGWIPD